MAEISMDFSIDLTEEQLVLLEAMIEIAKNDNGNIIFTLRNNKTLKGYIVEGHRVELINNFLDSKGRKDSKIMRKKFKSIYSKDKLIGKD